MDLAAREINLEKEISWKIREEINSNYEIKNFHGYLKKEKELFDRPRPIKQLSFVGIGLTFLALVLIYEILLFLDFFYDFLENEPIGPEALHSLEFSLLMVVTTLATILGLILSSR